MNDLRDKLRLFVDERDWSQFHTPKNLAMALAGEAAEILEIFQWLTAEESSKLSDEKMQEVSEEIGDVLIYLVRLADQLNIDPMKAAHDKIERNRIKYPAELVRGRADKYTAYAKEKNSADS